jgi:hypothetical protein
VSLTATRDRPDELDIMAPRQIFVTDGALQDIGNPAQVLNTLRHNPHLRIGSVRHTVIGGRPALQFELQTRHAESNPDVCGPNPCVILFPLDEATETLGNGDVSRISLLRSSGRTLVVLEGGFRDDRAGLAATAALLRTLHFKS